jgi:transcriptional regulator with XRE-family HTH domain
MAPVYITIDPEATGRNIRVLMAQNGYDIDDVREACGNVSPQAVYKWLSGKSLPSIDNLKILSVIFGTTMEGILVTDENAHVFSSGIFSVLSSARSSVLSSVLFLLSRGVLFFACSGFFPSFLFQ